LGSSAEPPKFGVATAVQRRSPGSYDAWIHPEWSGPMAPNGGYLAAILLRATRTELGRDNLPPRTLSVHYPRAAAPGPARIDVVALRTGSASAVYRSDMYQNDELICTALLTCAATRSNTLRLPPTMPAVQPWHEIASGPHDLGPGAPSIYGRIDIWPCFGAPPFSGGAEALTGGWIRFRDDAGPLEPEALVACADIWWPAVYSIATGFVGPPTLELTVHLRATGAVAGPVLGRYRTRTISEGYFEESAEIWSADGTLLAEAGQLALILETARP